MKLSYALLGIWAAGSAALLFSAAQLSTEPLKIEVLDPAARKIIPSGAKIEQMATGFKWTEGPVWAEGHLYFAEIPSNSIRELNGRGEVSIFMQPSGYTGKEPYGGPEPGSNGMTLDQKGRLTVAGHARRNIWRLEYLHPHAQITVLADSYQGKKLNSPNDLVYRSDGSLYFTDPPYGLRTQDDKDQAKELAFNGVFRIPDAATRPAGSAPDNSKLQLIIKDLPRPNGIAFSPDGKTLYVADSGPKKIWMRYDVEADGSVKNGRVFYDASADQRPGGPDGIKVDMAGNLYGAAPGGIWIFSPSGKHIASLSIPERVGNLAWGDSDLKTLYVAASSSIYRIRTNATGEKP